MWPFNTGDCLIEVTVLAGLAVLKSEKYTIGNCPALKCEIWSCTKFSLRVWFQSCKESRPYILVDLCPRQLYFDLLRGRLCYYKTLYYNDLFVVGFCCCCLIMYHFQLYFKFRAKICYGVYFIFLNRLTIII